MVPLVIALGLPLAVAAATAAPAVSAPDYEQACGLARSLLDELVAVDTTNPPGNEARAAAVARKRLDKMGIPATVTNTAAGRANLVARVLGNGSKRPLLLLAHTDVVTAEPRAAWSTDPFQVTEKDQYLYGRGVADDKGMAAIFLSIVLDLKRRKLPLARDVIVALTADEESAGEAGIGWLLKNQRKLVDAEFALNEGAGARLADRKLQFIGLGTEEKIYQTFFLEAEGPGGHSSLPGRDNPIYDLAEALTRLAHLSFPPRLTDTTRAFFLGLAAREKPEAAARMRELAQSKSPPDAAVRQLSDNPLWNAMLHTTCTATEVHAGQRENALPQSARATVNCRILPGQYPPVLEAIQRALGGAGGGRVHIRVDRGAGSGPASPMNGPVPEAVRRVAGQMSPGVPVLPVLSPGATDSRHLRNAGIPAYGLKPFPAYDGDARRAHGADERVFAKSFHYGCEFLYRTVEELAKK